MNNAILYGVGVGPGDPELLTIKAIKTLQNADVIAVPGSGDGKHTAMEIVSEYIEGKTIIECATPMIRDRVKLNENYDSVADTLCGLLDEGKTVAFITLGDPSVYSTYIYIHKRVLDRGYKAQLIAGVPSFCAVAATLNIGLCEGTDILHIVPSSHASTDEGLSLIGNKVLMKAGKSINTVCEKLKQEDKLKNAAMVECCGMENEKVYKTLEEFDGEASYFSVIIVKENGL